MYITPREIFFIPDDAVDGRKLGIQFLFLIKQLIKALLE